MDKFTAEVALKNREKMTANSQHVEKPKSPQLVKEGGR